MVCPNRRNERLIKYFLYVIVLVVVVRGHVKVDEEEEEGEKSSGALPHY